MQHRIRLTVSSWASWSGPSTDKCNRKRQQDASLRIVSIRPQCFNSECRSRRYRSQRGTWLISGNSCLCRTHFVNTICLSKTFSFFKAADYLRRSQEIFQVKSVSLTFYKFIRSYSLMIRIQKSSPTHLDAVETFDFRLERARLSTARRSFSLFLSVLGQASYFQSTRYRVRTQKIRQRIPPRFVAFIIRIEIQKSNSEFFSFLSV